VGGNLHNATIFALGIMPYISASIILQLMQPVIPYLERLSKDCLVLCLKRCRQRHQCTGRQRGQYRDTHRSSPKRVVFAVS